MKTLTCAAFTVALFAPTLAYAGNPGPCPGFSSGWALSGPGPITAVLYDQYTSQMYIVWNNSEPALYQPVPISVMQTFSQSKNWVQTFNTYIVPSYSPLLLQEKNNCPVLQEVSFFNQGGAICVGSTVVCPATPGIPTTNAYLLQENFYPILQEGGGYIWLN